jgi:hypothetical protein
MRIAIVTFCLFVLLLQGCGCFRLPNSINFVPKISTEKFDACKTIDDYIAMFDGFTVKLEWTIEDYYKRVIKFSEKEFQYK